MAFRSAFSSLRFPTTLGAFTLGHVRHSSSSAPLQASTSRFLPRQPSPSAPRESPFPLVFLRTPALADETTGEDEDYIGWSSMFAEKGYLSVEIDVNPAPYDQNPWKGMVGVLATQIRTMGIPFGPVIIATGRAGLLAQAYVEDFAVSGMVLVNPPSETDPRKSDSDWEWPEFKYEPHFPILLLAEEDSFAKMEKESRLFQAAQKGVGRGGKGVSVEKLADGIRGDRSRVEVERWMDRCGY